MSVLENQYGLSSYGKNMYQYTVWLLSCSQDYSHSRLLWHWPLTTKIKRGEYIYQVWYVYWFNLYHVNKVQCDALSHLNHGSSLHMDNYFLTWNFTGSLLALLHYISSLYCNTRWCAWVETLLYRLFTKLSNNPVLLDIATIEEVSDFVCLGSKITSDGGNSSHWKGKRGVCILK